MKTCLPPIPWIASTLCAAAAFFAVVPSADAARSRPVLNAAHTTFVADNGRLLRGPYTSTEWVPAIPSAEIANIKNLGFNTVHLYAESFDPNYPNSGSTAPGYAMAEIDKIVAYTRDLGLYLVITIGNGANNGNHNKEWAKAFWNIYAPRYKNETHVIYEIHNEPVAWGPPYLTATTPANALAMETECYNIIRAQAPNTPVILFTYAVFGGSGGTTAALQDIHSFNQTVFGNANAVWTNEAVAFHGYGGWKGTSEAVAGLIAAGYPCFMTEFTAHDWGTPGGLDVELTSELERQNVSWTTFQYIPPTGVSSDVTVPEYFQNMVNNAGLSWTPDYGTWPVSRRPFGNGNQPRNTPGANVSTGLIQGTTRIQAEDFDEGGQGVAYNDAETANLGGGYRPTERVDITGTGDTGGGYLVGWNNTGEWLEYTIWAAEGGRHTLSLRVASNAATQVRIWANGADKTGIWSIPSTGGLSTWATVSKDIQLESGRQKIRVEFVSSAIAIDFNWLEISPAATGSLANGTYRILNRDSGLALDGGAADNLVTQAPYTGAAAQLWNFQHVGADQYRISVTSDSDNWNGGGAPGDRLGLVWWWGVDGATQRAIVSPTSSGYNRLVIAQAGLDIEPVGGSAASGVGIQHAFYTGASYQQWAVQPASAVRFPGNVTALVASATQIDLEWSPVSGASSYNVKRATTPGGTYTTLASGLTASSYSDTTASASTTYYYVVTAVTSGTESLPSGEVRAARLKTRLKLDEASGTSAADASGNGNSGTIAGGAVRTVGLRGNAVDLDGTDDYATLPAGIVNGLTECSISTWVYLDALGTYSRVFDFGTGTSTYMFLTPAYPSGKPGFVIRNGSTEYNLEGSAPLPTGRWVHLALTMKPSLEPGFTITTLYVNGVVSGRNDWMRLNPASLGSTTLNYIGKSQFIDPYLNGRVDDFRVFSHALTMADVARLAAQRPRALLALDDSAGTTATDTGSGGWTGSLVNGPTWTTGQRGYAVNFDGVDDHATLPAGIVNGLEDFTVSAWVRPAAVPTWARVFDFGTGTNNYMFLTVNAGATPRFAIRTPSVGEQTIDSSVALASGVWSHVAVTLKGNVGTLYINGVARGTNSGMTLRPSSLGNTTLNYLGRSLWPDPYLGGALDDVRIYDSALSPVDIAAMAAGG